LEGLPDSNSTNSVPSTTTSCSNKSKNYYKEYLMLPKMRKYAEKYADSAAGTKWHRLITRRQYARCHATDSVKVLVKLPPSHLLFGRVYYMHPGVVSPSQNNIPQTSALTLLVGRQVVYPACKN